MVDLLNKYLHKNGYINEKESFKDFFLSHPNYPSLFAITDTLTLLSIENVALKVAPEQFSELPHSFLAFYENDIVLIDKKATDVVVENSNHKSKSLSHELFLNSWEGILIAIDPNEVKVKNGNAQFKWLWYALPFLSLIALSFYESKYTLASVLNLFITLIGLVISVFILQEKYGFKNELATKICSFNAKTSCDSVINSDKRNSFLGFSDLPILFFSISFLTIVIQPSVASFFIGVFSTLSLPIIFYAIWLQKFKIKKWCVLCLIVGLLITLLSIIFLSNTSLSFKIDQIYFIPIFLSAVLISSFWFFLRPILAKKSELEKSDIEFKKFKRNFKVFNSLSKEVMYLEGFDKLNGICLGNQDVKNQITIFLSPSCGYCHVAFKSAYELCQKFPKDFNLKVLFNINPENSNNPYKEIVQSLLILNQENALKAQEAIIDWHINRVGLEEWKNKWGVKDVGNIIDQEIYHQYNWCTKNEFNYTPVKMINDKLFPNEYDVSDLIYFVHHFNEETN